MPEIFLRVVHFNTFLKIFSKYNVRWNRSKRPCNLFVLIRSFLCRFKATITVDWFILDHFFGIRSNFNVFLWNLFEITVSVNLFILTSSISYWNHYFSIYQCSLQTYQHKWFLIYLRPSNIIFISYSLLPCQVIWVICHLFLINLFNIL